MKHIVIIFRRDSERRKILQFLEDHTNARWHSTNLPTEYIQPYDAKSLHITIPEEGNPKIGFLGDCKSLEEVESEWKHVYTRYAWNKVIRLHTRIGVNKVIEKLKKEF